MPTRREVIRFDAEPIKVRLDKGPHAGIECHGEYGIDWRYSINYGKAVIYLPTEGRDALVQCGAEAGDEVAIRRLGRNRWEAERIARELPLEPEPAVTRKRSLRSRGGRLHNRCRTDCTLGLKRSLPRKLRPRLNRFLYPLPSRPLRST
jgi:hypothetical protein